MSTEERSARWELSGPALVMVICIAVYFSAKLYYAIGKEFLDFTELYSAGGVILEGHRTLLYDIQTQSEFQRRLMGMAPLLPFERLLLTYNHMAYEALLFVPLALLPYRTAIWIWRILSLGMLLLSTHQLARIYNGKWLHVFCMAAAQFAVIIAFVQGQDSILLLLLLSSSLVQLNRNRDVSAGFLIAMGLFKPHLILPIAAVMIWKRGSKVLLGFSGGTVTVLLVSTAIIGFKGWAQMGALWRNAVSSHSNEYGGYTEIMPTLRGMMWTLGMNANMALLFSTALSVLLFGWVAWLLRKQDSPQLLFPPLMALTILVSSYVNAHDLSILFIPALAMLVTGKKWMSSCARACICAPVFMFLHLAVIPFLVTACMLSFTVREAKPLTVETIAA